MYKCRVSVIKVFNVGMSKLIQSQAKEPHNT